MAIVVRNTNYNGEVLERILTQVSTGNELVEKGLICVIPGVEKKVSVPRIKTGKMLQKRKENPQVTDSKGDFVYSEKELKPEDFMAFTVFNPRTFENIWRKWQPKGNLVFSQLPPEAQNALLDALSRQVKFELGDHFVNGVFGDGDDQLFNGILTQIAKDKSVVVVSSTENTMLGKLKAVRAKIPTTLRNNPALRLLMSVNDFDTYDDELTKRESKNADETTVNRKSYKDIKIETIASWPDGLIMATLCSQGEDSNLFAAVNLQDDEDVILIDKISNASELYFFKLLMKADTNIGFGEEVIVLDRRAQPAFKTVAESISLSPTSLTFTAKGGEQAVTVTATGDFKYSNVPDGFTFHDDGNKITVKAAPNKGKDDVTGKVTFTIDDDPTKTAELTLTCSKAQ